MRRSQAPSRLRQEQARREAEEQARLAAQEQARREAEEQARLAAQEQARREAEELDRPKLSTSTGAQKAPLLGSTPLLELPAENISMIMLRCRAAHFVSLLAGSCKAMHTVLAHMLPLIIDSPTAVFHTDRSVRACLASLALVLANPADARVRILEIPALRNDCDCDALAEEELLQRVARTWPLTDRVALFIECRPEIIDSEGPREELISALQGDGNDAEYNWGRRFRASVGDHFSAWSVDTAVVLKCLFEQLRLFPTDDSSIEVIGKALYVMAGGPNRAVLDEKFPRYEEDAGFFFIWDWDGRCELCEYSDDWEYTYSRRRCTFCNYSCQGLASNAGRLSHDWPIPAKAKLVAVMIGRWSKSQQLIFLSHFTTNQSPEATNQLALCRVALPEFCREPRYPASCPCACACFPRFVQFPEIRAAIPRLLGMSYGRFPGLGWH